MRCEDLLGYFVRPRRRAWIDLFSAASIPKAFFFSSFFFLSPFSYLKLHREARKDPGLWFFETMQCRFVRWPKLRIRAFTSGRGKKKRTKKNTVRKQNGKLSMDPSSSVFVPSPKTRRFPGGYFPVIWVRYCFGLAIGDPNTRVLGKSVVSGLSSKDFGGETEGGGVGPVRKPHMLWRYEVHFGATRGFLSQCVDEPLPQTSAFSSRFGLVSF